MDVVWYLAHLGVNFEGVQCDNSDKSLEFIRGMGGFATFDWDPCYNLDKRSPGLIFLCLSRILCWKFWGLKYGF